MRPNGPPSAVGLDLEWPFSRDKAGIENEGKVALVQLCDVDIILLIHISKMESVYTLSHYAISGVLILCKGFLARSK